MGKKKKKYSNKEKLAILKEHLVKQLPVTELCKVHGIPPSIYYSWQRQLFEEGGIERQKGRSENGRPKELKQAEKRYKKLEESVQKKDAVLAELMQEHIALKKSISGDD